MYEINSERLSAGEYIDFLKRTDLGAQYPKERFEERIERLLKNASISLAARDGENASWAYCWASPISPIGCSSRT